MTNHDTRNSSQDEERVRKVYVKDLAEKDRVRTVFRVTRKEKVSARSGKTFLSLTFTDRTGHVDGRVFERVEDLDPAFIANDYVLVTGTVTMFHGRPQVVAENVERLEPGPMDEAEFTPPPELAAPPAREPKPPREPREPKAAEAEATGSTEGAESRAPGRGIAGLRGQLERLSEGPIRSVLLALIDDHRIAEGFRHGKGGRAAIGEQVLSGLKLVERVAESYPRANGELLVAGVVLGGVARALDVGDESRLVGGAVLAAQKLHEKVRYAEVPFQLAHQLTHLLLALDDPRTGTAVRPALTLEAELVRTLVSLEARLDHWQDVMSREGGDHWTRPLADGRTLFRGPPGTRAAPTEGRRKRERKARGEQQEATGGEPQAAPRERSERPPREPREQREPREPREPKPPRPARDLPSELSFKPFSALASLAPASESAGSETQAPPAAESAPANGNGSESTPG